MKEIRGSKLVAFLHKALPQVRDTMITNHCSQVVPEGDRAVRFKWHQRDFRCSSRLVCHEYGFGLPPAPADMVKNEECIELEAKLKAAL